MKSERASQAKGLRRFSSQWKLRKGSEMEPALQLEQRGQRGRLVSQLPPDEARPYHSTAGEIEGKTWIIGWDWSHCMKYRRIPHATPPLGAPLPTLLPNSLKVLLPPTCSFFNSLLSDYDLHTLKTCLRSPVTFLLSHWGLYNALVIWDILMLLNTPSWKMPHPTAVWFLRQYFFPFSPCRCCLLFLSFLSCPHQRLP